MNCLGHDLTATGQPGALIWFCDQYTGVSPAHLTAFSVGVCSEPTSGGNTGVRHSPAFKELLAWDHLEVKEPVKTCLFHEL